MPSVAVGGRSDHLWDRMGNNTTFLTKADNLTQLTITPPLIDPNQWRELEIEGAQAGCMLPRAAGCQTLLTHCN